VTVSEKGLLVHTWHSAYLHDVATHANCAL